MATSSEMIFYRYSPENMDKNTLQKLFVGRGSLLESLVKEIENVAKKNTPRFYLILGPGELVSRIFWFFCIMKSKIN